MFAESSISGRPLCDAGILEDSLALDFSGVTTTVYVGIGILSGTFSPSFAFTQTTAGSYTCLGSSSPTFVFTQDATGNTVKLGEYSPTFVFTQDTIGNYTCTSSPSMEFQTIQTTSGDILWVTLPTDASTEVCRNLSTTAST